MSRNIKKNFKSLKSKLTKSLSKSKYDAINTSESIQNNSLNTNSHINNPNSINISTSQNNIKLINDRINTSENLNKPLITLSNLSTINHLNHTINNHKKNNNNKQINYKKYNNLPYNKAHSLSKNKKSKNSSFSKNENSRNYYFDKLNKLSLNEKLRVHSHNIRTTVNSPLSSTSKNEQIIKLKKEIENKNNEINLLKIEINEKNRIIKTLNDNLKNEKSEEEEYEEYSKKIMIRNVKLLTNENQQLRNEIEQYKQKIMKMMKVLYNMKNKGIPIDDFVENVENNNSSSTSKLNTDKSDITNNTFIPIYIENKNEEENDLFNNNFNMKNQMKIPSLNFNDLNHKYNSEYLSPNEIKKNNNTENEMRFGNIKIHFNNDNSCNIIQSPISSYLNNNSAMGPSCNYNINNKSYNSNSTNVHSTNNQNEKGNSYSQEILPGNDNNNNNNNNYQYIQSNLKNVNLFKGGNKDFKGNNNNNILLNNKFKMNKMWRKNNNKNK